MSYEFKRLSDVEELAAAPEGAKALAVVDGAVKRVPFGGGNANPENMMFDLEVRMSSTGQLSFTNNEQIQKAYDNNMSIYVVYYAEVSGVRHIYRCVCPFLKETLPIETTSAGKVVYARGLYNNHNTNSLFGIYIYFDATKFASDETLEVDGGSYMMIPSGATVVRAYASIL